MVHPYLRRRNGVEKVEYPSPSPEHGPPDELFKVLGKTNGVPLFQEQAMKLAIVAAKFTPDEANGLRRAMATFRHMGTIHTFGDKMIGNMVARGYERDFAERCFKQIEGFGTYGFPESHAASFAQLVYVSAWIKRHHPAAFGCALLNSQPMGFYAPAEIVRDAREHDVELRAIDVSYSDWDNTLEAREDGALAIRLGFRQMDGFRKEWAEALIAARARGFREIADLALPLPKRALMALAEADCFCSLGRDRREALWAVRRLADDTPLPLFAVRDTEELPSETIAPLPVMPLGEHVLADYRTLRLSLKGYPMQFLRELFQSERVLSCAEIADAKDGAAASCAGVVLVRQMPGAKGVVFITLSDETGIANVVVWPKLMERFRKEVMGSRLLLVKGTVQKSNDPKSVVHLVAEQLSDRTHELDRLSEDKVRPQLSRADAVAHPAGPERPTRGRHPRDVRILPKSRDFH
jgi:error-prone DNA polymerase